MPLYTKPRLSIIASSGTPVVHTGTTLNQAVALVTVPANVMGPNGGLRITAMWSCTNNANNKTISAKFGGPAGMDIGSTTIANAASFREEREVHNRGATGVQIAFPGATGGWGTSATQSVTTGAIDTTQAQDIVLGVQLANSADTVVLEAYMVELIRT